MYVDQGFRNLISHTVAYKHVLFINTLPVRIMQHVATCSIHPSSKYIKKMQHFYRVSDKKNHLHGTHQTDEVHQYGSFL